MVSRLSAKAEYRSMTLTTCEMEWFKSLLIKFDFTVQLPMLMHCDNKLPYLLQTILHSMSRTQYIEVDCHYVKNIVMTRTISTLYTPSLDQLTDIFTWGLGLGVFRSLCNKLGMLDIYAPNLKGSVTVSRSLYRSYMDIHLCTHL